jgi:Integrase zinc binding domain
MEPSSRICAISDNTHNRPLREVTEEREIQAEEMANNQREMGAPIDASEEEDDPTIFESISNGPELRKHVEKVTHFLDCVKRGYKKDTLFAKIVKEEKRYSSFKYRDGLLYTNNCGGQEVLCIPRVIMREDSLMAIVIDQAHTILGHFSAQKTADYIRRWYWWPKMGPEVDRYCDTCGICQANKTSTQRPVSLLHPLPIPNRLWGSIRMDFIGPFSTSHGYDYLWVVICRLTSMVHLIPVKTTIKVLELAS